MRGKVWLTIYVVDVHGITPAYAGKRWFNCNPDSPEQDHPRLCGEKRVLRGSTPQQLGSPPPMRGKVSTFFCSLMMTRITPAYAGKSA